MKRQSSIKSKRKNPADGPEKIAAAPRGETHSEKAGHFPIVGIGASAGGLEALELFLKNIPADSAMSCIIVQHLDPTHVDMMPELLQRATRRVVYKAGDRMKVKPSCVYVIPPNRDMSILHGVLHLFEPAAPRGLRLPIDFFFRSLAEDRQEHSIGVILSGMGTDGTLGIRAIKEKAGLVLVQDPTNAKFDGMPRSAVDSGMADYVAKVEDLAGKITGFLQNVSALARKIPGLAEKPIGAFEKAIILLRARTGHDFSLYKTNTVYRRIERRMGIHQIHKINDYVRFLQENTQEQDIFFKELLIGVTRFFRDPEMWDLLKNKALAPLLTECPAPKVMRGWVTGCSTGEEAYSLAMIFQEALEQFKPKNRLSLQVFATDLDKDGIDKARQAIFPENIAADVSPERLRRFFKKEGNSYRVNKEIREMVIFAPQNLIKDPPFTKLDILCCRNLLIYLTTEVQKKLLALFNYTLIPGGVLFLGSAESVGNYTNLFTVIDGKSKLYKRNALVKDAGPVEFPSSFSPVVPGISDSFKRGKTTESIQSMADRTLLRRFAPSAVIVNDNGDILYINGRTGKYLEPAAGKATLNIFAMGREGLRNELASAFQKAKRTKSLVSVKNVSMGSNGGKQSADFTIQPINEPEALRGMFIVAFTDAATPAATPGKSAGTLQASLSRSQGGELGKELEKAQEELANTREEMQTAQEELMSTNEEMQSTNEELQSTNEELTTSQEEMQSLNEELQTVNAELQTKLDELSRVNNDMINLLNSTDIATIFLDNDLNVRRFTPQATNVVKLIPGDVGRPLSDLFSVLLYPELIDDVQEVLRTLVFKEKQITTRDARWFTVRIMPYRTVDNVIDGVVITFADITRHLAAAKSGGS